MMGERPYIGKNRKDIKEQMMSKQIYIDEEMIPFPSEETTPPVTNIYFVSATIKT